MFKEQEEIYVDTKQHYNKFSFSYVMSIVFALFLIPLGIISFIDIDRNTHCIINVKAYYSGCGIAGQPLESGMRSYNLRLEPQTVLYESSNGCLVYKKPSDVVVDSEILRVIDVTEQGLTFETKGEIVNLNFDSEESYTLNSLYTVYDGINYIYDLSVLRYKIVN